MKRLFLVLAVLIVPAMLFAGGGGQQAAQPASGESGGYLRFAWWGNTVRDERTVKVAQLFMEKNPGVTIETEPTSWDGYWPKINTQVAAGSAPDVMQQDYAYIEQFNNRNQLEDLTSYSQSKAIDLTDWAEAALGAGRLGGKLIALSLGTNTWGMSVDPAILQKAGITIDDTKWTWKDFERIGMEVYQKTGVQTYPVANEFFQTFENVVRQFGVPNYGNKQLGWTGNAAATNAIKEIIDMNLRLKAAGALYDPNDSFIQNRAFEEMPMSLGKTWNNYNWSNQYVGYLNAAKRPIEYIIFPSVNGPKEPYGTYLKPSQFISMMSSSENKALAAKFIDFFVNDLEANRILLAERGIPVPTDVRADLSGRVDASMKYLFDFITKVTPYTTLIDPPDPAVAGEVRDVQRSILLQCLTGNITSQQAVDQITQAGNAVLAR